jgi:hypothetical protein
MAWSTQLSKVTPGCRWPRFSRRPLRSCWRSIRSRTLACARWASALATHIRALLAKLLMLHPGPWCAGWMLFGSFFRHTCGGGSELFFDQCKKHEVFKYGDKPANQ